jgi:hypothetical protein
MISTYTKDFFSIWKKKWPKFARFRRIVFSSNHQIFIISLSRQPRIWKDLGFVLFCLFFPRLLSYLVCSVIWLNDLMDDYHFSNITKLNPEKKTLEGRGTVQPRPNSSIISIYLDCEQKKKEKKNLGQKLVLVKLITNNETSNSVKSLSQISHKKKSRL